MKCLKHHAQRLATGLLLGICALNVHFAHAATDCNAVTEIPVSECQSLLELYNSTNGTNWKNNSGWNQTNTPCSWFGIACSGDFTIDQYGNRWYTNLYIDGINLINNRLIGFLPNLNFPNLQLLDLMSNQLTGNIPNFAGLPNIQYLNLMSNQLTGNIPNFDELPNMQYLYLANNKLSGNIPNLINLSKLKDILLGPNQLTGNIPNFNHLPSLEQLDLHKNQLIGVIPDFNFPSLKFLALSDNQLTGNIPVFNFPNLYGLYLNNNQLTGVVPNFTSFNLANLQYVDFSNNCGLTSYDSAQEIILNQKNIAWATKNLNCPLSNFNLIIDKTEGGIISVNGNNCETSCSKNYDIETQVNIVATPIETFKFASWTGDCEGTSPSIVIKIDKTKSCQATFEKKRYPITFAMSTGGSISPDKLEVEHGSISSFSITPSPGFVIDSVTGCNGKLTDLTYATDSITDACEIKVNFKEKLYALTVNNIGGGQTDGAGSFAAGTIVNLTPIANIGYKFSSWSLAPCANSFVMPDHDLACNAHFEKLPPEQFTLTVDKVGNGTVSNGGSFVTGATVNLTATPDAGYKFIGWNPSTCKDSFAMPAQNLTCTATFEKIVETNPLPVVSQCTTFTAPVVNIPCVNVNNAIYQAKMNLISNEPTMRFAVDMSNLQPNNLIPNEQCAVFPAPNTLDHLRINCLDLGDKYWADLKLVFNPSAIQFDLVNFGKN